MRMSRAPSARLAARQRAGLPARAWQTYQVLAPVRSHWRQATCEEVDCPGVRAARCEDVDCPQYHQGWRTVVPAGSDLAHLARQSGRTFIEVPAEGGLSEFRFPAGQQCFARHQAVGGPCQMQDRHLVSLERPGLYVVRGGDRRDRTGPVRQFKTSELWAEHFAEHQDKIRTLRGR